MNNPRGRWTLAVLVVILSAVLLVSLLTQQRAEFLLLEAAALFVVALLLVASLRPGLDANGIPEEPGLVVRRFPEEGVTIIVPWQGRAVDVEKLPNGSLPEQPGPQDDFTPKRLVIDWRVYDRKTKETIYTFDPPLKFQVRYTPADFDAAGGLERLKLASVLHKQKRWMVFSEHGHGFKLTPDKSTDNRSGVAFVERVTLWDDRHTAWGG